MIKDYNMTIRYQYDKVNVIVDALSRKYFEMSSLLLTYDDLLIRDLKKLYLEVITPVDWDSGILAHMII